MTLVEHLKELRKRVFISLLAVVIITIVIAVWAYHPIFDFLRHPYCELPPARRAGEDRQREAGDDLARP